MTTLIESMLGPQVAIIDNNPAEIRSIEQLLNKRNIGNKFFEVDSVKPNYPESPLTNVELVFLDLYYNPGMKVDFDPYPCIDWLEAVVPRGKKYILVVWSNDTHETDFLLKTMEELEVTMPFVVETKGKTDYQSADNVYDIERLLNDLNVELEEKIDITSQEFYGQVISIEKSSVLINCLILQKPATFEVRRFDLKPFQGNLKPEKGMFLKIVVTNKPGSKIFDFIHETQDLSELFQKADDFEDIDDISFLNDETEEEDENNI